MNNYDRPVSGFGFSPESMKNDLLTVSDDDDSADAPFTSRMPPGNYPNFYVNKQYTVGDYKDSIHTVFSETEVKRLDLSPNNLTVPAALMLVDPELYPSFSKARKTARKGAIIIVPKDKVVPEFSSFESFRKGRVSDRVGPGDVLAHQLRLGTGAYTQRMRKSAEILPVLYEDNYFALVNKPAGLLVYRNGMNDSPTVHEALPWSLQPPPNGFLHALRRPSAVHRLDKPTSGVLVVAKTKPARMNLSQQFRDRVVQKTYMAIVNGRVPTDEQLQLNTMPRLSSREAYFDYGIDIDPTDDTKDWYLIDYDLKDQDDTERNAVTIWRPLVSVPALYAIDGQLTLVELKPKTGRFHQLRQHMALYCKRPLVGDKRYDGNHPDALKYRGQGLFLCSTRVKLQHPHYNTEEGREQWEKLDASERSPFLSEEGGKVMITVEVDMPLKFQRLLERAEDRHYKFSDDEDESDLDE
jgi:23S rRNA-/tRNA-specific pseudouridylate synthase